MQPGLTVILPTLDEAENIRSLIPRLLAELPEILELIVVDDGSTDGTRKIVRELGERDTRVRLLARTGRPCLSAAIQDGIDASTAPLIGWMDADGAMTPSDLSALLDAVKRGADLAVGSRFVGRGRIKGQSEDGLGGRIKALLSLGDTEDSWTGVALSWALNGLILPLLLLDGVHDYTSGFVVARRAVLDSHRLRGDHGEYFIHLWVSARRNRFRIEEVPYQIQPRLHGRSKTANSVADWWRRGRAYLGAAWRARREG